MGRIKAQGTLIKIETGSGGAKNITDADQSYPVVITSAAHGFSAGDRVTIAAVGGMTELNGNTYTVEYATTNTFALKGVNGTGYGAYTSGGTATPVTLTAIGRARNIKGGGGEASEMDGSDLGSTAKEFESGLADYGSASCDINVDFTDAGQNAIRTAFGTGAEKDFQVTYIDGTIEGFVGFVKGYEHGGEVDGFIQGTINIRKTGVTTWT